MELREKLPKYVVMVPDYNWSVMPLGGFPSLGISHFYPGFAQAKFRIKLDIPGTPTLISRPKDAISPFNRAIDHFGVVFATGPEGWPLPDDLVFELQADTNHEHTPMPYKKFYKGEAPLFYPVKIDSKAKVIERLEKFFRDPKRYRPFLYNCEDFAREIMTGIPACYQRDRAIEGTKTFFEIMGKTLVEAAEQERKRRTDLEEARRRQTAVHQVLVQSPTAVLPPPVAAAAVLKPMTLPKAVLATTLKEPKKLLVARTRKPANRPRKKAR